MTKLACRTSIPIKWTQDELAPTAHADHLLLVRWLIATPIQGRGGQYLVLRQPGKPVLERFLRYEQWAWNRAGSDTGGSVAP